jgi:TIR domain
MRLWEHQKNRIGRGWLDCFRWRNFSEAWRAPKPRRLRPFGSFFMPDERQPAPNQNQTAGDSSTNYQAGRDLHVHNHPTPPAPQSVIQRPSDEQVRQFDPKTRDVITAADKATRAGRIFISYRRSDSAGYAGRIYDSLRREFGAKSIFMDVDSIPAGDTFAKTIEETIAQSDVVLALIGQYWLVDAKGQRLVDNERDFPRMELASALRHNIPVIPILLEGVTIPSADQLPDDLKRLLDRQTLDIRNVSFRGDIDRLIRGIKEMRGWVPRRHKVMAGTLLGLLGVSFAILMKELAPVSMTVTVPANENCVNVGMNVAAKERIRFSANGIATYGPEGEPLNYTPTTNPDGDRFDLTGQRIPKKTDPGALLPSAPVGALVGKVNNKKFFIGTSNQFLMPEAGALFLCYNDSYFPGNTGEYEVTITR